MRNLLLNLSEADLYPGTTMGISGSLTSSDSLASAPAGGIIVITSPNTLIKLRTALVGAPSSANAGYSSATIIQIR